MLTVPPAPIGKFEILCIEDDPHISRLLREVLTKAGFVVRSEPTAGQGLTTFGQMKPHLVLLDLMLPDSTGYEVCNRIRQTSAVPIIMLTARGEIQDQLHGFKLGADDYVVKPFDPKLLLARVVAQLRRVYRYDAADSVEEKKDAGPGDKSLPHGWLQCESCGYMGPRDRFEDFDSQGMVIFVCPNCRQRMTYVVA